MPFAQSPNHWTSREVPGLWFLKPFHISVLWPSCVYAVGETETQKDEDTSERLLRKSAAGLPPSWTASQLQSWEYSLPALQALGPNLRAPPKAPASGLKFLGCSLVAPSGVGCPPWRRCLKPWELGKGLMWASWASTTGLIRKWPLSFLGQFLGQKRNMVLWKGKIRRELPQVTRSARRMAQQVITGLAFCHHGSRGSRFNSPTRSRCRPIPPWRSPQNTALPHTQVLLLCLCGILTWLEAGGDGKMRIWIPISCLDCVPRQLGWEWDREDRVKSLSHVWLFATPWTVAYQAPPSRGFSMQEY